MFRRLGLLDAVVCPAHRDGECEPNRVACPYSHDLTKLPRPGAPLARVKHARAETDKAPGPPPKRNAAAPRLPRHEAVPVGAPPCPRITQQQHPASSPLPLSSRQDGLQKLHHTLAKFYAPLLEHERPELRAIGAQMCKDDALGMEADVFRLASAHSYRNSSVTSAVSVTKRNRETFAQAVRDAAAALAADGADEARAVLSACTETGTGAQVTAKREQLRQRQQGQLTRQRALEARLLCPRDMLAALGYVLEVPEEWGVGGERRDGTGERHECARCGTLFRVAPPGEPGDQRDGVQDTEACRFHPGRLRYEVVGDSRRKQRVQRWQCCGRTVDSGVLGDDRCSVGPHTFKEEEARALHAREGFVTWAQLQQETQVDPDMLLEVAAMDCEMCYTTAGMSVTRITLVDETGQVLFDELIRPAGVHILDYNTQYSGIHADEFAEKAVFDLASARRALASYIGPNTILVRTSMASRVTHTQIGHGLENDLKAMRLVHDQVIDTCHLFPHPRGFPFRMMLRELVATHLGRFIQTGGKDTGHSSAEDAQATLDLVRWKWNQAHR